jgi:uncharacterized protein (TIGR00297 family)
LQYIVLVSEVTNPSRANQARLQWQSKVLVAVCVPVAAWQCLQYGYETFAMGAWRMYGWQLLLVPAVSLAFAVLVAWTRAATVAASLTGGLFCCTLLMHTGDYGGSVLGGILHSGLPALIVLFVLTYAATKWRRARKLAMGVAETQPGRSASQVVANLGVACIGPAIWLAVAMYAVRDVARWQEMFSIATLGMVSLAALAEATADTLSSEIGQAMSGKSWMQSTWMITNGQAYEAGVDGGVSVVGTAAGLAGAVMVVLVGALTMRLNARQAGIAFAGGVIGSFADSFLGAMLERRGWINNDAVNFLSTLVAVVAAGVFLIF